MRKIELLDSDGTVVVSGYSVFGDFPGRVPPPETPTTDLASANDAAHPEPSATTLEAA